MAFKYETIVPWGRSYPEYRDMFALTAGDLAGKILGCGDGPASFNCVLHRNGGRVVSLDPIYYFSRDEIQSRIDETYRNVIEQTWKNRGKFVWTKMIDPDNLGRIRMNAMKEFLADYETGKAEGRYIPGEMPELPFPDSSFDLALSSHFLFLYTDNLTFDFHLRCVTEMLRVAREVRIFPLLDVNAVKSPYADELAAKMNEAGYCAEEVQVDYEFQKGGNRMLKISKIL